MRSARVGILQQSSIISGLTPVETRLPIVIPNRSMTREELEAIPKTSPVDVTFFGKEDTVRYFSQPEERSFSRAEATIASKVRHRHPPKAYMHWSRYFAVRDKGGEYVGMLELAQDTRG